MTREEAERELIGENCPCFFDLDELLPVYDQVPEWVITERIARREAEAEVRKLEGVIQVMAEGDSFFAERAGLEYDEAKDKWVFKEKP